jgi:branched-chain amino acid transport system ATP-binding protein
MLRAEHISVAYGAHRALEDVTLHVAPGEIVVILGANGAGKSTLLKAIARLIRPAPGATIAVNDNELTDLTPSVEQGLALVPEGRGVFADLTVGENLELGAYGRQARNQRDERLAQVLELFPRLAERRRQVVRTMSGGEQQMVAIGRALMSNPAILMLDEPSLGLSPILSSELFRTLSAVRDTGVGILLVEQNARLSLAIADRAYLLENGCIVGEGRAAVLANRAGRLPGRCRRRQAQAVRTRGGHRDATTRLISFPSDAGDAGRSRSAHSARTYRVAAQRRAPRQWPRGGAARGGRRSHRGAQPHSRAQQHDHRSRKAGDRHSRSAHRGPPHRRGGCRASGGRHAGARQKAQAQDQIQEGGETLTSRQNSNGGSDGQAD